MSRPLALIQQGATNGIAPSDDPPRQSIALGSADKLIPRELVRIRRNRQTSHAVLLRTDLDLERTDVIPERRDRCDLLSE